MARKMVGGRKWDKWGRKIEDLLKKTQNLTDNSLNTVRSLRVSKLESNGSPVNLLTYSPGELFLAGPKMVPSKKLLASSNTRLPEINFSSLAWWTSYGHATINCSTSITDARSRDLTIRTGINAIGG
jgi:hypothetical protein